MIILSVGMPRAGSGWYYNLMHDLVMTAGGTDARGIRKTYNLDNILTEVNCNISALTLRRVSRVLIPSWQGKTFTIKAHSGPTLVSDIASILGWMRISYIYRDPRDALLSAIDFGKRTLEKGKPNAFSHLTDLDQAIQFMLRYCGVWEAWMKRDNVLHSRYEDLLSGYDQEVTKLLDFLKIPSDDSVVQSVVEKYRPGKAKEGRDGLHFYKGQIGRFREKFSAEDQEKMAKAFTPYLARMGYPI